MSMVDIAEHLGGHPNRDTVGRIISTYLSEGMVVQPRGKKGVQHQDRKFDDKAWEVLVVIVTNEEQSTLQGKRFFRVRGKSLEHECMRVI